MKALLTLLLSISLTLCMLAQEIPTIDWDALQKTKPWTETEVYTPIPPVVIGSHLYAPPSDAIVLFDGNNLDAWHKPEYIHEAATIEIIEATINAINPNYKNPSADWTIKNGQMIVKPGTGAIETKEKFGDIQLHLEFLNPVDVSKEGQMYSNSGVFLMGIYEVQILNSYENTTYSNGQVASVYKQHIPLVNAARPPGEWQMYDIIFKAPVFDKSGNLQSPATLTVLHNGVLVQNHVTLLGPTAYIGKTKYFEHPSEMPLRLQDHGDLVRFRNIWLRKL